MDAARKDAAPRPVDDDPESKGGGSGGSKAGEQGASGTGEPTSSYRSENNFGTSAEVPGTPRGSGKGSGAGAGAGGGGSELASAGAPLDTGNPSSPRSYMLLALILAIGLLLGAASTRGRQAS